MRGGSKNTGGKNRERITVAKTLNRLSEIVIGIAIHLLGPTFHQYSHVFMFGHT